MQLKNNIYFYILILLFIFISYLNADVRIQDVGIEFQNPVETPIFVSSNDCGIGDACYHRNDKPPRPLHVAIDFMALNNTTPAYSTNYGKIKQRIIYNQNSHAMGNVFVIEHLLQNGELILSLHAHLNSLSYMNINDYVSSKQQIGIIGNSGNTINQWGPGNYHDHFELKRPDLEDDYPDLTNDYNDLWPFGYMDQSEANDLKVQGETDITIIEAINRSLWLFTSIWRFI